MTFKWHAQLKRFLPDTVQDLMLFRGLGWKQSTYIKREQLDAVLFWLGERDYSMVTIGEEEATA